jgi:hypothetical protein
VSGHGGLVRTHPDKSRAHVCAYRGAVTGWAAGGAADVSARLQIVWLCLQMVWLCLQMVWLCLQMV